MTLSQLCASAAIWAARVRWRTKKLGKAKTDAARAKYAKRLDEAKHMLKLRTRQITLRAKPARGTWWHPNAMKVSGRDAGAFVTGRPRIVWHTTEGDSAEGAIAAYRATGSWPHFTFEFRTGRLFQHIPLNRSARALEHPPGTVETNRARAIQVELVGRAAASPLWTNRDYQRIAGLARWIEASCGVERKASAQFSLNAGRLGDERWLRSHGHLGHEHVPNNHHWDPGAMKIAQVV